MAHHEHFGAVCDDLQRMESGCRRGVRAKEEREIETLVAAGGGARAALTLVTHHAISCAAVFTLSGTST